MLDLLDRTRESLGPAPREVPKSALRRAPAWALAKGEDAFEVGKKIFRRGFLTSGSVVTAAKSLLQPRIALEVALVLHPTDPEPMVMSRLSDITARVTQLLSRSPEDPELVGLKQRLERGDRLVKAHVPATLSQGAAVALSSVTVTSTDLPRSCLRAWFLPVLVHPKQNAVLVLPKELWEEDLREAWDDLAID